MRVAFAHSTKQNLYRLVMPEMRMKISKLWRELYKTSKILSRRANICEGHEKLRNFSN